MRVRRLLLVTALVLSACAPDYIDLGYDYAPLGTGGSTGSGGTGGGKLCTPGETKECYTGPQGTKGQGICTPGQQTCNADGSAFGACEGEQLPKVEDCATPLDEDCDGLAPPCKGVFLWAKRFGEPKAGIPAPGCRVNSVAIDPASDDVLLTGAFNAKIDLGGGSLESAGGTDIFLALLNKDGGYSWASQFGDGDGQSGMVVRFTPQSASVLAGVFSGVLDVGTGALVGQGATDLFVAAFDANGVSTWSRRYGDDAPQDKIAAAVDAKGGVALTGGFLSSLDFGNGPLNSAGNKDAFVAKLAEDGTASWSKRFGDSQFQEAQSVAIDPAGNILVVGVFSNTIDLGSGPMASAGDKDVFIAKLAPDGTLLWAKVFGDAQLQENAVVGADPGGGILLTGSFYGEIDLGGGPLASAGGADIFLAKLGSDGEHLWSKRFGDAADQLGISFAFDGQGNIALAGTLVGAADFGGGPLASAGGRDIFLAKLDPNGEHLWSKRFGDAADQQLTAVAADAEGTVIISGYFAGGMDLGGGLLTAKTSSDGFVAKFAP